MNNVHPIFNGVLNDFAKAGILPLNETRVEKTKREIKEIKEEVIKQPEVSVAAVSALGYELLAMAEELQIQDSLITELREKIRELEE